MSELSVAAAAYSVFAALMVGSFINLAADRLPRGESLFRPRSHCRSCGRQLNAIDLAPVLGYVVRAGRCATCKSPIGVSSPVVEAMCGSCMLATVLWLGPWPGLAIGPVLLALIGTGVVANAYRVARA